MRTTIPDAPATKVADAGLPWNQQNSKYFLPNIINHLNYALMPITPNMGTALVAGGSNVLGVGLDALIQSGQNKEARRYSTYMYDRQRADALADWNMQNEYNSPQAQMARLKAAGLNPMLVYGSGSQVSSASTPRGASEGHWQPQRISVQGGLQGSIQAFQDTRIKQLQTDLINEQIANLKSRTTGQDIQNIGYGYHNNLMDLQAARGAYEYKLRQQFGEGQESARLVGMQAHNQYTIDENERRTLLTNRSLDVSAEQILNMRASRGQTEATTQEIQERIKILKQNQEMNNFEIQLNKLGLTKSDPMYQRAAAKLIQGIGSKDGNDLYDPKTNKINWENLANKVPDIPGTGKPYRGWISDKFKGFKINPNQ